MSYHRPQDQYIHSNASEYDTRYQQGAYTDDPRGAQDYYGGSGHGQFRSDSPAGYSKHGGDYGSQYGSQYELTGPTGAAGGGGAGAGAGAYGAGRGGSNGFSQGGPAYKDYSSSGGGAPAANAQKYSYAPKKKPVSKWVKIGIPVGLILLVCIGVGVGIGVWQGTKGDNGGASTDKNSLSGGTSGNEPATVPSNILSAASSAAKSGGGDDLTFQGTDLYGNPSFKASANTASPSANGQEVGNCADDAFSGSVSNVRSHPRIMTTAAQWSCLPEKIQNDAYLTLWNYTIFQNATAWLTASPVPYDIDGGFAGSGVLDPAREVQLRVKTFAYAYHLSGNDTKWSNRAWQELLTAAGNNSDVKWGTGAAANRVWNPTHFLDTAELTAAFAIGYDWLYDAWTPDQRTALQWSIIVQGLQPGRNAYTNQGDGGDYRWWLTTNGNWNCVCNSGLLLGALAIAGEDPTNSIAQATIGDVVGNMKQNCMQGVYPDGTWSETANYWYFGANAQARAVSALTTATGDDQKMMASNQDWSKTGLFHMYVSGMASMFFYGDNGPNKYSTNANGMFLWGKLSSNPLYALFQRDRADAADPLSMFWYDTSSKGGFWNGLALDKYFDYETGAWVSMRSSWTDFMGMYVAMKASNLYGHQTHGDLDVGDFVIDALGTRWAGEFGSGNYLSSDYFASEENTATRWKYYRKGTQGQNTIVINKQNQNSSCLPVNNFGSTNVTQTADIAYVPGTNDVAFFTTDMSSAWNQSANTVVRGIRFLNGRRQVLLRDEIAAGNGINDIDWRVHTNATVSISSDGRTATLTISSVTDANAWGDGQVHVSNLPSTQKMIVKLTSPSTATFKSRKPDETKLYDQGDPNQVQGEVGDQPNPGVTLLWISLNGGSDQVIETVWQPQWPELTAADNATPKSVPLSQWTLTSHN